MVKRINSIQALRFIAAFSVIFVHLPMFGFGAWGVDIFFVISGFIMAYITNISSENFLIKRLIRIVPLYWMLTLIVFIISIYKPNLLNNTTPNIEHLIKSLLFIPFDKNGTGHFPILFLGWSLNFEILFYLVFFISIKFKKRIREYLAISFLILIFLFSNFMSDKNFIFKVYSDSILLEFIYGIIIFKLYKKNYLNKFINKKNLSFYIFFIFLITLLISSQFDLLRVLSYGLPASLILLFFLTLSKDNLFHKSIILLGDASYAIYLSHPFIIQIFYKVFKLNIDLNYINFFISLFLIVLILVVSIIIHIYFEKKASLILKKKLNLK